MLARDVIQRFRECLIDLNTWGDAIFATAKDPVDLASFALALRDFFVYPPRPIEKMVKSKLKIRIAIDLPLVRIAKNHILSPVGKLRGCFGRELTLAARIEPVTPPNTIFVTRAFGDVVQKRDEQVQVVPYKHPLRLPKRAGRVEVSSLHRTNEKPVVDWQDPLKKLEAVAPMFVDSWFVAQKPRHNDVEVRLRSCRAGEKICFIAVTGKSIIFKRAPLPGEEIVDVSAVAQAISNGASIRGVVLDPTCDEAKFRSRIERNNILVKDAKEIEGIPNHSAWLALKRKVQANLLLRKTCRGLSFNLWLFSDRAIIEPYHFGKLPEKCNEPHMCKFSQFTVFRERDEEYRMLAEHFERLWKDARPVWPRSTGKGTQKC